jgi:hypothetical protein
MIGRGGIPTISRWCTRRRSTRLRRSRHLPRRPSWLQLLQSHVHRRIVAGEVRRTPNKFPNSSQRLPPPCLRRFGIQLARSPVGPGRTRIDASRASLDPGIALRQTSGGPSSTGGPGRTLAPEPNDGWRQLSHLSSALTPRRGGGVRGQAATDSRQLLPSAHAPGGSFPHPVTSDGAHASPTSGEGEVARSYVSGQPLVRPRRHELDGHEN